MTFEAIQADLAAHETRSQSRFETLLHHLGDSKMSDPVHIKNIFEPAPNPLAGVIPGLGLGGAGAGAGAGLGAGLLGGVLASALFRNGGVFGVGDGNVGGVVTPALLASSLAQVTDTQQNTAVLQGIGDIKAAVPLAESQVQLALAGTQAEVISNQTTIATAQALASSMTNQNIANSTASILASEGAIKESIAAYGVANLTATKDASNAIQVAIGASTKEIIAALNEQNTANLQRQLTVAEQALLETRSTARSREVEVTVTQNVAQNQAQVQAQQQQQQQLLLLAQIAAGFSSLQNAVATNSNLIVGNTGATTTGPQTANPVNVRT